MNDVHSPQHYLIELGFFMIGKDINNNNIQMMNVFHKFVLQHERYLDTIYNIYSDEYY